MALNNVFKFKRRKSQCKQPRYYRRRCNVKTFIVFYVCLRKSAVERIIHNNAWRVSCPGGAVRSGAAEGERPAPSLALTSLPDFGVFNFNSPFEDFRKTAPQAISELISQ
ncbi:unnamed protein product [Colias eurytheme]|nr:unnamed protein product [Colias eurytheme]